MRLSIPLRPTQRHTLRPSAAGIIALVAVSVLCGCSQQALGVPAPTVATAPVASAPTSADTAAAESALHLSSSMTALELTHWATQELPLTITGGTGPVTLRMERTDGVEGDVIEVTPSTVTPGEEPTTLRLRATHVAFPQPEGAAPWRLVASQGGRDVASLDLSVALTTVHLSFTLQPVTAAEGQTVDVQLTVDADSHDLPPFSFTLSPYIVEETESYEPVPDAGGPRVYRVTTLPATFQVPIAFRAFHGDPATNTATFQLSVDGLAAALGSQRYAGKYVRANLTWHLAP